MGYWTTEGLTADDQSNYWADVVCQAFTKLQPTRRSAHREGSSSPVGVPGWVRSSALGTVNTAEIESCTQLLSHGRREIARANDDVLFVNLQLAGSCLVEQDDRRSIVGPGSFSLVDARRPFTQEYRETETGQPWRVLSFRIPHSQWSEASQTKAQTAVPISGTKGDGAAVGSLMTTLWAERDELSEEAARILGVAFAHTLAGSVAEQVSAGNLIDGVGVNPAVVRASRAYIREALPFGRVAAAEAARRLSISVRTLHRAFESEGVTFAGCVQQERLLGARADLETPGSLRSLSDIAARWGYCDSSHMTRTFKRELGCTPTEYRLAAGDGSVRSSF